MQTTRVELITPELAKELLANSRVNRKIRLSAVIEYCQSMERGEWQANGGEPIQVLEDGSTGNGHHRAHAVIMFGKPVKMLVSRGAPLEARLYLDKVLKRTLEDEFRMFRPKVEYPTFRVAYMRMCIRLVYDGSVKIANLSDYDAWHKVFGRGVEWATKTFASKPAIYRVAGLAGGMAFVYRTDPKKAEAFGASVISGEGLRAGDPALAIRNFVAAQANLVRFGSAPPLVYGRKVVNAFDCYRNGIRMQKLTENADVFREYVGMYAKDVKPLIEPWLRDLPDLKLWANGPKKRLLDGDENGVKRKHKRGGEQGSLGLGENG